MSRTTSPTSPSSPTRTTSYICAPAMPLAVTVGPLMRVTMEFVRLMMTHLFWKHRHQHRTTNIQYLIRLLWMFDVGCRCWVFFMAFKG